MAPEARLVCEPQCVMVQSPTSSQHSTHFVQSKCPHGTHQFSKINVFQGDNFLKNIAQVLLQYELAQLAFSSCL